MKFKNNQYEVASSLMRKLRPSIYFPDVFFNMTA